MDIINKSKWQVRVAAIVIFLLGFAAGALALNAYKRWNRSGAEASRQDRFERMLDTLQLNADQKRKFIKYWATPDSNSRRLEKNRSRESEKYAGKLMKNCRRF